MLKFVVTLGGQRGSRMRALGLGALAAIAAASSTTGALAQDSRGGDELTRSDHRHYLREIADQAYVLAEKAPDDRCRTARVDAWLEQASRLERQEPPLINPGTSIGHDDAVGSVSWIELRQAIIRESNLPPCPGVVPVFSSAGVLLGIYLVKTTGDGHFVERFAATDQVTNVFDPSKDPVGLGASLGYKFGLGNSVALMPFVSAEWPNISVRQTFPNTSFLGTRSNFSATAGVKAGPQFQNVWLYGIAGVSVLNETLNVNFIPVASSTSATVAGTTVGAGFAYTLPNLARPVSLFVEYQHTWWQDAHFNTPAASPFFNYTFARSDDVVKVGFTMPLDAPSAPLSPSATPPYPVKAPPK
jgi:hypothetical protein